jgi:hypothetical protein
VPLLRFILHYNYQIEGGNISINYLHSWKLTNMIAMKQKIGLAFNFAAAIMKPLQNLCLLKV